MGLRRFLSITVIVTTAALVYVCQQTSLVRLSYDIKNKEGVYGELLDRNRILLYNVKYLESPVRLEKELTARNMKLEVPSKENIVLVSIAESAEGAARNRKTNGALGRLRRTTASILTLGPEAQAKALDKNIYKK